MFCGNLAGKTGAALRASGLRSTPDGEIHAAPGVAAPDALVVNLADPKERTKHLADPGAFAGLCRALPTEKQAQFVFVDEAQAVPAIFDAVQHLYDADKMRWRFVLCGSSVRKLRRIGANLLPGRSFYHRRCR